MGPQLALSVKSEAGLVLSTSCVTHGSSPADGLLVRGAVILGQEEVPGTWWHLSVL